jgi:WD40 repeat protein
LSGSFLYTGTVVPTLVAQKEDNTSAKPRTAKIPERLKPRLTLAGHGAGVLRVVFSPNGKLLASTSSDSVKIWDTATGNELKMFVAPEGRFSTIRFSPDGKLLVSVNAINAAGGDGAIIMWDVATWEEKSRIKDKEVTDVVFSSDGKMMAGFDGRFPDHAVAKIWDTRTGKQIAVLKEEDKKSIQSFSAAAFSPDGKVLVMGTFSRLAEQADSIRLWDLATKARIGTLRGCSKSRLSSQSLAWTITEIGLAA